MENDPMKTIYLEETSFAGSKRIKLIFRADHSILTKVKLIRGCSWSNELVAWHMPWEKNYIQRLEKLFGAKVRLVTFKYLGAFSPDNSNRYMQVHHALIEFVRFMITRHYSEKTMRAYSYHVRKLFSFYPDKLPNEISNEDITIFKDEFINTCSISPSTHNQLINAIKLFYKRIYNPQLDLELIQRPRLKHKLPTVLSRHEVESILNGTQNLKHKTVLWLIYSAGLRVSEAVNVMVKDIDRHNKKIHIRNSPGGKDRNVNLSSRLLKLLKKYREVYRPKKFLFEGPERKAYSIKSVQVIFQRLLLDSGIKKMATVHTLRHSFATHLVESGTDIKYIQELMGHKTCKTTMIYSQVGVGQLGYIKSPLDGLKVH
jgi:integrase/recombinase XerD